jgi:hypothetical protein
MSKLDVEPIGVGRPRVSGGARITGRKGARLARGVVDLEFALNHHSRFIFLGVDENEVTNHAEVTNSFSHLIK